MNLNNFQKYKKNGKVQEMKLKHKTLWGYTRVSSKDQTLNSSIQEQRKSIEEFAKNNGYTISKFHGGTYESAKGDMTRKEFKALIDSVVEAKIKPNYIATKFISRFSRSGGEAIGLVHKLVHKVGVHLIETSSGVSTETEEGEMIIFDKLLESRRENMRRLERTIPGMKSFLMEGNWLGKPPRGYTTYGERVSNFNNRKQGQEIRINDDGQILKKAWKWKAEGMTDANIRRNLDDQYHLQITKQGISEMWRKPFYVGVNTNAMLDVPVKGNWRPLVSEEIWDQVQKRLEENIRKSGYEKAPVSEHRPLTGFIYCANCGTPITSYIAKKKQIHYYKCQSCKGGNMNAFTTPRSIKPGVNDTFVEFLKQFEVDEDDKILISKHIEKVLNEVKSSSSNQRDILNNELGKVEKKLSVLRKNHLLSYDQDEETFQALKQEFSQQILSIQEKISEIPENLSNQSDLVNQALDFCKNLSKRWVSGDINKKLKIQNTLFPDGLIIVPEKRHYRTKKMNQLISVIKDSARGSENSENKKSHRKGGLSCLVAGTGLEPVTFGL
ncbi:recombinase family protein [Christiangramia portivictoriae]|uniref:recombinase family protein n=1 Tax=Christiangramia portivictoriae TaxID=326069 RepID=UPI00047C59AD|nr:recombinase family protein [Christiangramia portivictoriae]